jgi:hypothetical protein
VNARGSPPRYAPEVPFPTHAFVPGRTPRHPRGEPRAHERLDPKRWRECETWLHGVDLYNHGYAWEAHEAWERLWIASRDDEELAALLQGLIQCAASVLKLEMSQPGGARTLGASGTAKLERVHSASGERVLGVDVDRFVRDFRAFLAREGATSADRPWIELA